MLVASLAERDSQMTATVDNAVADLQRAVAWKPLADVRKGDGLCETTFGHLAARGDGDFSADYAGCTPARRRELECMIFTTSIERAAVAGLRDQLFGGIT
jgi:hypothetical protein